jgi:hypothetical protein
MNSNNILQSMQEQLGNNADTKAIWEWINRNRPHGVWMCMYDSTTYKLCDAAVEYSAYVRVKTKRNGEQVYIAFPHNPISASATPLYETCQGGAKVHEFSQPIHAFKLALELMEKRLTIISV